MLTFLLLLIAPSTVYPFLVLQAAPVNERQSLPYIIRELTKLYKIFFRKVLESGELEDLERNGGIVYNAVPY
jgi:hypothetical protein